MSKQEQIEELKRLLAKAHADADKWGERAVSATASVYKETAEQSRKHAEAMETAAKLAREQEAIDLLKLGYVKVETLRGMILQDYEVGYNGSSATAEMRLRLRSGNRVETALQSALTEGAKPKFATGGYVSGGVIRSTPFPAAWNLVPVPHQDVVQLSPADRQLLSDINNSVKIKFPGRDA